MDKRFLFLLTLLLANVQVFGQTQPVITSFSPQSGGAGTSVTITGLRFSAVAANNVVFFGDVKAVVTAASSTTITATVPSGASNKPLTVTVNRLTATSSNPFRLTYPVAYAAFTNNAFVLRSEVAPSTDAYLQGSAMATGDFDGDGKIDFVSSNAFGASASVFRNTGDPVQPFLAAPTIKMTPTVTFGDIATGDVNGDGKLDVVMVSGTAVRIYLNTGNAGSFNFASTAVSISIGRDGGKLNLADIDGDGRLDIAVGVSGGLSLLRNTSSATAMSFAASQIIRLPNYAVNICLQDIDGDQRPEIIYGYDKKLGVLSNNSIVGTMAFGDEVTYEKSEYARFSVADVDGDDKADVVVSEPDRVSIYRNLSTAGNIALAPPQSIDAAISGKVTVGDLNGDGKPEIIISSELKKFQVLANSSSPGTMAFTGGEIFYLNSYLGQLLLADWNNDGRLDLGINHASATASILVNQVDAPSITSYRVDPANGGVTIKGNNFRGINTVKFGAAPAIDYAVVSENEITATSPEDIQGAISVIGTNGTASLNGFSSSRAPSISSFSPQQGVVGSVLTITGKNFSVAQGANQVYFGTVAGTVTAASSTSLTVTVPAGTSYSRLTVVANGLKAVSSQFFRASFGDGSASFPVASSFVNSNTTLLTASNAVTLSMVALSDLDGDGRTDLIVGQQDYFDMYSNTGDPIAPFKVKPDYSLQLERFDGHHLADLDGDGKLDIISLTKGSEPYKSTINLYRNLSTPSGLVFEKREILGPELFRGQSMVTGDLDGDGREDLMTYDFESPISIYRNVGALGKPYFGQSPKTFEAAELNVAGFHDVQLIDLDGDGKLDVVASYRSKGSTYGLMFFRNSSENGTFDFIKQEEFTGLPYFGFSLADLNNDGLADIVVNVNASSGNVRILENRSANGSISFVSGNNYTLGSTLKRPAFGDMDGDGKVDMAIATTGNKIALAKNTGTGATITFSGMLEVAVGENVAGVVMADINGDGKLDLAVVDGSTPASLPRKTNLLLNAVQQPTLTKAEVTVPGADQTVRLSGTNLNGATKLSVDGVAVNTFSVISATEISAQFPAQLSGTILVTTAYGTARLYGFSSKPVPLIRSFSPARGPIGTIVTLIGSNFDALAANNIVFFGAVRAEVLSASTTSLSVKVPAGANYHPISVAAGGLVAYSAAPFVVTYDHGASVFLKRNAFAPKQDIATSEPLFIDTYVNSADLDGDGRPDLVTTNKLFRNTGDPKRPFIPNDYFELPFSGRVIFADLDGDGKLDLANLGETAVRVYRNTSTIGNFSFTQSRVFTVGQAASNIVAGDIDGDGKIDLIVSNRMSNSVSVLRNLSTDNGLDFAPQQDYATAAAPTDLCVADFDGDGRLDIATANFDGYNISVLRNTSTRGIISLASRQDYSTNDATTSIAAGDLDGDGKPDLVTSSFQYFSGARDGAIFKNLSTNGAILFGTRVNYFQNRSDEHLNAKLADLDGDGKPDLVTGDRSAENISLYPNISTSTNIGFGSQVTKPLIAKQNAYDVVVGDWNMDGKPDLAVKNGPWVSILLNQAGLATPEITKISPAQGGEGTKVVLTGNFFDQASSVSFGGIEAKSFTVLTANSIEAIVALNQAPVNPQEVRVVTPNGIAVIEGFSYLRKPTITSYVITGEAPNYTIVINGFDLTGATAVSFGGVPVGSFVVNASNRLTATSQTVVTGDLSVTTPGGTTIFRLAEVAPTLSSINIYSAATGASVELTGTNLGNLVGVTFGGVPARSFTGVSSTKVIAVVGSGASGEVVVRTLAGSASLAGFIYLPPPELAAFSPAAAATNQVVTITGKHFAGVTAVKFGNVAATSFTVVSTTMIQAVLANGASGEVEVVALGGSAKLGGFSYLPPPVISSFSPATAIEGQMVTIRGSDFTGVTGVSFGDVAAASFKVVSGTTIEAVVATGASGAVKVTTSAGVATRVGFIFSTQPSITSVSALVGGTGSQVTITGVNLSAISSVTFGGRPAASFSIVSATTLVAVLGDGASGQIVVGNAKGETAFYNGFVFVPRPVISIIGSTPLVNNAKALLRASTGKAFAYVWRRDGLVISGSTGDELEISQKGSYTVSVVSGAYTSTSEAVFIDAYFMLPANNFKIQRFGTSCIGVNDGSFIVDALSPQSYSLTIVGSGVSRKLDFTNLLEVKQLPAGTYSACVTVAGQADYRQCFTIVIQEPQKLAVYASVMESGDKLKLLLTGAANYTIELNGNTIRTDQGQMELPLKNGANQLRVTTDQSCQGTYDQTIFYTTTVMAYPNPFRDKLRIQLPQGAATGKVRISITDTQGRIVLRNEFHTGNGLIELKLDGLAAGVYLLKVATAGSETIQKIIKQ